MTLQAARAAVFHGRLPYRVISVADAEQAQVQAYLKCTQSWVGLPHENRLAMWTTKYLQSLQLAAASLPPIEGASRASRRRSILGAIVRLEYEVIGSLADRHGMAICLLSI